MSNFQYHFGDIDLSSITSEQILTFLSELSTGTKPSTKRLRFTLLSAFFNIGQVDDVEAMRWTDSIHG